MRPVIRCASFGLIVLAACGSSEDGATTPADDGGGGSSGASGASAASGHGGGTPGKGGAASGKGGSASSKGGEGPGKGGGGNGGGNGGTTGGGGSKRSGGSTSTGGTASAGGTNSGGSTGGSGASSSTGGTTSTGGACIGAGLLGGLGKTRVLVGASMSDATAAAAPFDLRYQYLSGAIFDGAAPCASCASGCTAGGQLCDNQHGCGWWGCWQYDKDPPGGFVRSFVAVAKKNGQIPWITYYQELQASGASEGKGQIDAAKNVVLMTRYFADFRFLLQTIGSDVAFVHHEPDFWGYAQQAGDPHATPIAVASANPVDCGAHENSAAGLGKCLITMARKYAPNVKIGLHASGWSSNMDVLSNKSASLDVAVEAAKTTAFLSACGAGAGDFIVSDMSDRDAGYYQSIGKPSWWDASNATLPRFHQAFAWGKAISEGLALPLFWWQTPVGNAQGSDTKNHWKDNRVDYLFAHMNELAEAHAAGVLFGAGDGNQTTLETDGGNVLAKMIAYGTSGGQTLCP